MFLQHRARQGLFEIMGACVSTPGRETMKTLPLTLCLLFGFASVTSLAQDDPRQADREAMLVVLTGIETALNERDLSSALRYLHENVVITYHDATVTRGPQGAMDYYNRMMEGAAAIVTDYSTVAKVSDHAIFYGDTAVAYGTTVDNYVLARGLEFTLNANWTATVVKENGEWLVAALHFSTDLFDNPLLNSSRNMTRMVGVGGLLIGMLLMWIIGRMRKKSAKPNQ